MSIAIFVAIGLFLQGINSQTTPETCVQALNMPCIAYCNQSNVFLNISGVFQYPYVLREIEYGNSIVSFFRLTVIGPDGDYSYTYQPYYGLDCNPTTNSPRSAVSDIALYM